MSLLIRADDVEHVLRSVGDAPNGIVCMGTPDGRAAWIIDGQWDPTTVLAVDAVAAGSTTVVPASTPTGLGEASHVVDVEDLVAGCASLVEARALMVLMSSALGWSVGEATRSLNFEFVGSHVDLAIATRDALATQGFLRRPE